MKQLTHTPSVTAAIGAEKASRSLWKPMLGALVLAGSATTALRSRPTNLPWSFRTAPLESAEVVVTVDATGSLAPREQVEVGSEQSGILMDVLVTINDAVRSGQVLARLDPVVLKAQAERSQASLDQALAQRDEAAANALEAKLNLERGVKLREESQGRLPSLGELDRLRAAQARTIARVAMADADIKSAQARLASDTRNLRTTEIVSPIDGIVLDRTVDPGQTIAAAFQTPTLFSIAADLTRMELRVDVDEADIGKVELGQSATFSVDAYPGEAFSATIRQIQYASKVTDGVVTYEVVLDVSNPEVKLRPGMTATARIVVASSGKRPAVPNAALRVKHETLAERTGGPGVWWLPPGSNSPVWSAVELGLSDGRVTELAETELSLGSAVVTGVEVQR